MDPPVRTSGNVPLAPRIQQEKPPSPTHSYLSTRTDKSMDRPVRFKEGFACEPRVQVERAGSPVSTCMSVRSDWSKDDPPNFKGVFSPDESGVWPGGVLCDFCTEGKLRAVKSCLTCTASYCETHLRQHSSVPVRQRHTLVEATGNLEHRLCPQHHRALELFCNTDQMPICSLCLTPAHRGHDVVCSEPGTQNDSNTKRVDEWIVQHHPTQASARVIPTPVGLTVDSVTVTSFSLCWSEPHGLDQTPSFLVSNCSPETELQLISTELPSTVLSNLQPGRQYTVSVCTVLENGEQSEAVSKTLYTEPSSPESLRVEEVKSRSVRLCWDTPTNMEGVSYTFSITYTCDGEEPRELTTESNSNTADLCDLKPGMEYSFSIFTVLHNDIRSRACSAQAHTQPSAPGELNISSVCETSLCLSWDRPTDMEGVPHTFRVTWGDSTGQRESITTDENPTVLSYLRPVTEYSISVCTVLQSSSQESEPVHTTVSTKPSPPESLRLEEVKSRSVRLCWDTPTNMEGVSYTFSITYTCDGEEPRELTAGSNSSTADLCDLKPGMEYSFSICTVLHNDIRSRACSAQAHTQPSAPGELNISSVCETSLSLSWDRPTDMEGVPHTFRVTWGESTGQRESITTDENPTVLSYLRPETEYSISVCTVLQSTSLEGEPVHTTVSTS